MGGSLFWTVNVVCGWGTVASMTAVVGVAVFASVYTALGGLKSVAVTDVLQFGVMTIAAILIWIVVFDKVGGFSGTEELLANADPELPKLLYVGHDYISVDDAGVVTTTPAWLVMVGFLILGLAYPIVNHTQSMRMFGSKK